MTDDNELTLNIGTEALEELQETDEPVETAIEIASGGPTGALSMAGGAVLLLWAVQSLARRQLRAIPKAIAGVGLLRVGLRKRRASERSTFEPDVLDEESAKTSDEAHTAATRETPDPGEQPREDPASDAETADTEDEDGKIEFTHDEAGDREEPRSKPDLDAEAEDPRRDEDDEEVEIDVSESALADEASEAAGPSPEQAQPSQTDATEPEETPEEDASDMKVEPDDADESDSTHSGEAEDDVDESDEEDEADR